MTPQSVCAVIVTYHPTAEMCENMSEVLAQVQGLVVVDNGSNANEVDRLRAAGRTLNIQLIENADNLGIAEALNQGVHWAKCQGYPWVILLDQDSRITVGFVRQIFAAWEHHADRERVGTVYPRYADPKKGMEAAVPRTRDGTPVFPMTSGALMPTWIFDRIGWFATEYFIDILDWEYCFRIRAAGYLIADSSEATLLHAPGHPQKITILGHTFCPSHHSAMRRYYISRNCIVFYRKYFYSFPFEILSGAYRQLKDTIVCFIAEKDRARKLRSILLGTWDGVIGRMGKRAGL